MQSTLHIHGFYILKFNQTWTESSWKKIPEISKKQNLNLPHNGNYFHSIYTVLSIMSVLEII